MIHKKNERNNDTSKQKSEETRYAIKTISAQQVRFPPLYYTVLHNGILINSATILWTSLPLSQQIFSGYILPYPAAAIVGPPRITLRRKKR